MRSHHIEIIGTAIAIILASFKFWLSGQGYYIFGRALPAGVEELSLFFFILVLTEMIARIKHKHEIEQQINGLQSLIPIEGGFRYVGVSYKAVPDVVKHLENAERVFNTFIVRSNSPYTQEDENTLINAQVNFLNKNQRWTDIVSENSSNREKTVREKLKKHDCDRYRAYIVAPNVPILNFIIIEYASPIDGKEPKGEVWFGWGFHNSNEEDHVFSTTNPQIIRLFGRYFESIKSCANSTPYNTQP